MILRSHLLLLQGFATRSIYSYSSITIRKTSSHLQSHSSPASLKVQPAKYRAISYKPSWTRTMSQQQQEETSKKGIPPHLNTPLYHSNVTSVTSSMTSLEISTEAAPEGEETEEYVPRFIDVGINLTDKQYQGFYNGSKKHEADLDDVIDRGVRTGCERMMVTGSSLKDSKRAVEIAEKHPGLIYATVGIHPCSTSGIEDHDHDATTHLQQLEDLALWGKERGLVTAFGEIGLDYDRLFLSKKEPQLKYFEAQLRIAERLHLPLFLHSRAAEDDFERLLLATKLSKRGLVHSFTGNVEEMKRLVDAGFDIGINGCSLKTEENLNVLKEVPMERIQLETDGPWCEIRPSHASARYLKTMPKSFTRAAVGDKRKEKWEKGFRVKGRNEPCAISQVAWVVSQVKGIPVNEVCEISYKNSMDMFKYDEADETRKAWEAKQKAA